VIGQRTGVLLLLLLYACLKAQENPKEFNSASFLFIFLMLNTEESVVQSFYD
jgi:hypothetical protein